MEITKLDIKTDERGWLAEVIKRQDLAPGRKEFGQFFVTTAQPGVSKGHHYHLRKHEWFCVIKGRGLLVLEQIDTKACEQAVIGDGNMATVRIPPGYAHAIKNVGDDLLYLLCYTDEPFDPDDADTSAYILGNLDGSDARAGTKPHSS